MERRGPGAVTTRAREQLRRRARRGSTKECGAARPCAGGGGRRGPSWRVRCMPDWTSSAWNHPWTGAPSGKVLGNWANSLGARQLVATSATMLGCKRIRECCTYRTRNLVGGLGRCSGPRLIELRCVLDGCGEGRRGGRGRLQWSRSGPGGATAAGPTPATERRLHEPLRQSLGPRWAWLVRRAVVPWR